MYPVFEQKNLSLKIKTVLGKDVFLIDKLTGFEQISSLFEFEVNLHSSFSGLDLDKLLGTEVNINLESTDSSVEKSIRYFCGVIGKIEQNKTFGLVDDIKFTQYKAYIYPKLWLLKFNRDYRIFQNNSAIDIIQMILDENMISEIENHVSQRGKAVREFCVQYGESCFDFICRLMEEEGIFYYFSHSESGHKLILADSNSSIKSVSPQKIPLRGNISGSVFLDTIYQFNLQKQVVPKSYQTVDYNYLTPQTGLQPKVSGKGTGGQIYDFPGKFDKLNLGEDLTNIRIQALEWSSSLCQGESTALQFIPGKKFELEFHPRKDFNCDYTIYRVSHVIDQQLSFSKEEKILDHKIYTNHFESFPSEIPFRSSCRTPKPRIYSNQTAIVTGPKGEEVFCDKYGRIKIKFHWDIKGKNDETSSCWVRVAQNWAGTNWGGLVIPRIGMEVVVTFIEGDPDLPLVIGCVYNADYTPPDYVTSSPTKSTFKTNTSKKGGGFNELRFEDAKDKEEIYLHAQKDWKNEVENCRIEDILKGDDTLTLHEGNKSETLTKGSYTEALEGSGTTRLLKIKDGDDVITIKKGNYTLTLDEGNMTIKVTGKVNITSTDDISLKSDKNISLEAGMNVQIKAGMSIKEEAKMSIESKANMSIKQQASMSIERKSDLSIKDEGMMINIEGKLTTEIKGSLTAKLSGGLQANVMGGAMCVINGGIVKIN